MKRLVAAMVLLAPLLAVCPAPAEAITTGLQVEVSGFCAGHETWFHVTTQHDPHGSEHPREVFVEIDYGEAGQPHFISTKSSGAPSSFFNTYDLPGTYDWTVWVFDSHDSMLTETGDLYYPDSLNPQAEKRGSVTIHDCTDDGDCLAYGGGCAPLGTCTVYWSAENDSGSFVVESPPYASVPTNAAECDAHDRWDDYYYADGVWSP